MVNIHSLQLPLLCATAILHFISCHKSHNILLVLLLKVHYPLCFWKTYHKKRLLYIPTYYFWRSSFLSVLLNFHLVLFIFCLESFNISFSVGLLVVGLFSSFVCLKVFILHSFLKDIFCWTYNSRLGWQIFSFGNIKMSLYCLLAGTVSV